MNDFPQKILILLTVRLNMFGRLIPESTRWLIAKKKYSEARLNIDRAARVNAKMIPSHMFQPVQQLIDPANAVDTLPITEGLENLCHALRSSTLFKRLLVALLCWYNYSTLISLYKIWRADIDCHLQGSPLR